MGVAVMLMMLNIVSNPKRWLLMHIPSCVDCEFNRNASNVLVENDGGNGTMLPGGLVWTSASMCIIKGT